MTVRLDPATMPRLADHVVQGVPLVPGSVLLDLIVEAAGGPPILREVRFPRALVLPRGGLDITVRAGETGEWEVVTADGVRHASARVADHAATNPIDPEDPRWSGGRKMSGDQVYAVMRAAGNEFGPAYRIVAECRVDPGAATARVDVASLDAAMQVLAVAAGPDTFVLAGVDELSRHDRPASRVFARMRPGWAQTDDPIGDVLVVDAGGRPSLAATGVRLRRLPPVPAREKVVVTATFTAEPLADTLGFWLDATVEFAPYRQVHQELLDPGSRSAANSGGTNVLLLRAPDLVARPTPPARPAGDGPRRRLPGVGEIAHLRDYETDFLYDEIFVRRAYLRHGIDLPDGAVVIDAGANIGLFTLFVHERCAGARVFAFEPAPDTADALRRNVAAYCPDTRVFDVGLAEAPGERPFTYYPGSSVFSGFAADPARDRAHIEAVARSQLRNLPGTRPPDAEALLERLLDGRLDARIVRRPTTTVSRVLRAERLSRVDLLKIDAEGYEERILQGIDDEDWPAIRQVVVEAHDPSRAGRVRDALAARGFVVTVDDSDELLRGTGFANVFARRPGRTPAPPLAADRRRAVEELLAAVRLAGPLVVALCPSPSVRREVEQMAPLLADGLAALPGVQVITADDVRRAYPVARPYDPRAEELGDVPYTRRYFAALGTVVARRILATRRPPVKVLALDCDETLWAGRCGEDGPCGVRIEAPHRAVQEFAVRQHAAGTLVCLCSRNNPADVLAVLDGRDDLVLRREHLTTWRLNWEPKSVNLASLAAELGVGTDSVVLLDDDPVECAEVRAHRPEVLTVCLPADRTRVPALLDHLWPFDRGPVTAEDVARAAFHRANRGRDAARAAAPDLASFLAGLELRIAVEPWTVADLPRIAQLTHRVNQFTTAGAHFTPEQLRSALAAGLDCLVVRVADRFGDYGLVGVMLFRAGPDRLRVEGFLLSCRALGRGVEHRMLAALGSLATRRGLAEIDLPLTDTGRNAPARAFLEAVATAGGAVFTVSAPAAARVVHRPAVAARPRTSTVPVRTDSPVPYARIAEELNDLDAIVAAIERSRFRHRPSLSTPAGAPDDELERELVAVWREVLAIDEVGIDDNFFELGGTSLRAVQLTGELTGRFGRPVPAIGMFEHPTVRAMSELLRGRENHGGGDDGRRRGLRRRARRSEG